MIIIFPLKMFSTGEKDGAQKWHKNNVCPKNNVCNKQKMP